jgi:hypothetical protein
MFQLHRARMVNGAPEPFPQTSMAVAGPDGAVSLEVLGTYMSVEFHSRAPWFDGDSPTGGCPYLDGVPCYTGGGTVQGEPAELMAVLGVDEEPTYAYLEGVYRREWGER